MSVLFQSAKALSISAAESEVAAEYAREGVVQDEVVTEGEVTVKGVRECAVPAEVVTESDVTVEDAKIVCCAMRGFHRRGGGSQGC